jgi:hypothetical protein
MFHTKADAMHWARAVEANAILAAEDNLHSIGAWN